MQQVNATPRAQLTRAQVVNLLTGPGATWDAGAELLNPNLSVVQDLTPYLQSARVSRVMAADVHGSCAFALRNELSWGTALVRLFTTVSDNPVNPKLTARFNCGVFATTTPQRKLGLQPVTFDVTGYDRLYLLKRQVGDSYTIPAGTGYLTAITAAISAAGLSTSTVLLDGTRASATLPRAMSWPLVKSGTTATIATTTVAPATDAVVNTSGYTTWLDIINTLLAAIGYRGLWADENGYYRSEPYLTPKTRPIEWTFTIGGVTAEVHAAIDATMTLDDWGAPNKWVFVQRNPLSTPTEGAGQYTVTDSAAYARRGNLWWPTIMEIDAVDQAAIVAQGNARVAADKQTAATIERKTRPFPLVGHADIYTVTDPDAGGTFRVQSQKWEQDLFGGDTSHTWALVS